MRDGNTGHAPAPAEVVERVLGAALPVGLRGWDGSEAGPADGPRVVLRSRRALHRLLWNPSELGLARAYVSGDLDVEGDITTGLRRFWATAAADRPRRGLSVNDRWTLLRTAVRLGVLGPRPRPPAEEARLAGGLRPGGRLLFQQMSRGATAPGGGAFIESYVAPDMTMRPLSRTLAHLENAGLEIRDVHALREHYVRTVREWAATLERRWDEVVALVGEGRARVWRLYLAGGALAFEDNRMGVDQVLAVRPTAEGTSGMPSHRGDLRAPDPALAGR
ncbi:class I SAM-dependent methyltransferase [Saccharothrix saharensis]|uniref:class I SAM-dependent methyltransferase n=1 Tax=Saccharothrix saharensis TaxID=571190 RepID=UPI0036788433